MWNLEPTTCDKCPLLVRDPVNKLLETRILAVYHCNLDYHQKGRKIDLFIDDIVDRCQDWCTLVSIGVHGVNCHEKD